MVEQDDRELYKRLLSLSEENRANRRAGVAIVDALELISAHRIAAEARGMESGIKMAANIADSLAESYHEPVQRDYDRRDGAIEAAKFIRAALKGNQ